MKCECEIISIIKLNTSYNLFFLRRRSKDYFTSSFFPPTDHECDWSWRNGRCEPSCECRLRYNFGDFHLGRSCRWRTHNFEEGGGVKGGGESTGRGDEDDYDDEDDEDEDDVFDDTPPQNCDLPPVNSLYYKALTAVIREGKVAKAKVQGKIEKIKPRRKVRAPRYQSCREAV